MAEPEIHAVLCVEDEDFDAENLRRSLRRILPVDFHFHHARSLDSAREALLESDDIEALFVDLEIDGRSGLELVQERRRTGDLRPMIMVTGQGDEAIAAACMRAGADDYLPKSSLGPSAIRRALHHAEAERGRRVAEKLLREQKRHLEDLLVLAEQGARAKASFLANVTHELRTPLTAILGCTESLVEDRLSDEEKTSALQAIAAGGRHLLSLINDILDLSKSEAGALEVNYELVDLSRLITDVDLQMRPLIEAKGVEFRIEKRDSVPDAIVTDGVRVRQILINLLGNACKFTSRGSIVLSIGLEEPSGGGEPRLTLAITDTGIGMSARRLERIFEPFVQADSSISRTHGGTGLGLSITRELVTLLGGEIGVTSALGRGTTFQVKMPQRPHEANWEEKAGRLAGESGSDSPVANEARWSGRALVVDDAPVVRKLASRLLRNLGFEVEEASGAIEGLDAYDAMGESCQLVLLDLQMPKIDGVEAARRFRDRGFAGRLVAMSATPSYEEIALAAGCDGFLPKPFDRRQVRSLMERLFGPAELSKVS